MAKRKGPNKSAAIRAIYRRNPDAKPREIVAELKQQGITVSAQQVSTTRMNAIKSGLLPPHGSKIVPLAQGRVNGSFSVEELVTVKKLVDQLGGIKKAEAALSALSEILN